MVGNCVSKETPKSHLDLDLGFVNKLYVSKKLFYVKKKNIWMRGGIKFIQLYSLKLDQTFLLAPSFTKGKPLICHALQYTKIFVHNFSKILRIKIFSCDFSKIFFFHDCHNLFYCLVMLLTKTCVNPVCFLCRDISISTQLQYFHNEKFKEKWLQCSWPF